MELLEVLEIDLSGHKRKVTSELCSKQVLMQKANHHQQ